MSRESDVFYTYEEDFHGNDRKISRMERKKAIEKDRSKYKKTDQDQLKKKAPVLEPISDTALRGRVLGIYPEGIQVDVEGKLYRCQLKGSLKKEKQDKKNLVAIGDFVFLEPREEIHGLIFKIEPRYSILSRADNLLRRKEQLIAVNIDQVIITASIAVPSLKPSLLDRYIIAAKKGNMAPVIVINKIDLLPPEEKDLLSELAKTYEDLSIPFLRVSTKTGEGIDLLKKYMEGKTSVFSGQSGTGKSSLINATIGSNLKTGSTTEKTMKGSHTTTTATLLPLENGGFCVDTPGIKSFGVWDLDKSEVEFYYTEISTAALDCKFPNCSHTTEPSCAVQQALEKETISPLRFASYLSLLETFQQKHRTR